MFASDLSKLEYAEFYANYIHLAGTKDLISGIASGFEETLIFLNSIPEEKLEYSYEDGKWTIKDVIQHMIDTERIFAYRALCFARKDRTSFPGFGENSYAVEARAIKRSKADLLNEYEVVRKATLCLFKSMDNDMLLQIGEASQAKMSVRAIGFVTIGHEKHHCQVIKSRYF